MRKYILIALCLLLSILTSCNKHEEERLSNTELYKEIKFYNQPSEVLTFTVSTDGEIYLIKTDGILSRYKNDGTLVQQYDDVGDITAMCWDNDIIYAYDAVKGQIINLDTADGEIKPISENFEVDEVLKLVKNGNYLYALAIPDAHASFKPGLNGYMDFGEILYRIDLKNGKIQDLDEDNIIAIYNGKDNNLYYYAYRDDEYALYSYNSKSKSSKLFNMNDTGYISAFVYEKESFICSDLNNSLIKMINPVDSSETVIDDKVLILSGNDMTYLGGNVIYFALGADKNPNEIKSVFLDKIKNDKQQENGLESDDSKITDKGKIIVSTSQRQYIDTTSLKRISGIGTRIVDQNVYEEVLLTEIMAGNPDVDIYITSYGSYVASGVRDKKIYMPLNDSDIICNYMDKCFDYVAEAMKSQSGDIWALPISLESQVIWYVPENIDKFSIDLNEFTYLDSFFKLSEKIPKDGTYVAYLDYPGNFGGLCHNQYDSLYNDYDNNSINFNTPLYKDLFDKVWTGWVNYSPLPRHPLFRVSKEDYNNEMIWETASFDKSKLIFKWSGIGDHLNTQNVSLDGWRALPMPRISSDVKKNRVIMRCAFINPYSKNKELALEYLESITKIPFEYSSEDSVFLFKDEDMYEGKYNTEQVAFIDIYNIINDGFLTESNYLLNYTIIDDYQNGRLTIDEAIAKIQREAEMWANE